MRALRRSLIEKKVFLTFFLFLFGCVSSDQREYQLGKAESENGNFPLAVSYFEKTILRTPDGNFGILSAREAAKISFFEIKDFKKAAEFYKHLVLYSNDPTERIQSQKQLVSIYFDRIVDYNKAVLEINKLLQMSLSQEEKIKYKISLARSYYYQNNFEQAENEVDEFLRTGLSSEQMFSMLMLKGNISLARKDLGKAVKIYKEIIEKFEENAKKENVGVTLALTYEEMKDYKSAILTLGEVRKYHSVPEYIDLKIKKLQERQKNQPGAKGYRK